MKQIYIVVIALLIISCKNETNAKNLPTTTEESEVANIEPTATEQDAINNTPNIESIPAIKTDPTQAKKPKVVTPKVQTKPVIVASNSDESKTTPPVKTVDEKPVLPPVIKAAPVLDEKPEPTKESLVSIHDNFNAFLGKYVSNNGKVNYNSIKANKTELDVVIKKLQDNPPKDAWSKNEKLAYWINAYNAFTIKKIVDNYPLSSITDLDGGKPWDVKWIKIDGKTYSLNNIENDIIRPTFKDPRIHFAVNCAAKSCPPLLNKAYTGENVNSLLTSQAKKFINNASFNKLEGSSISISKIFDWYKEDFGNITSYLNKYATTKIASGAKVEFMEYNWSLNN